MKPIKLGILALTLGAVCGAGATEVNVYGSLNTGFRATFAGNVEGVEARDSFSMETGQFFPNMFGIKGSEDLGNGLKVGFVLESRFNSDSGTMSEEGRFFDNQSLITIEGTNWDAAAGRMEGLSSTMGHFDLGCPMDPFEGGWAEAGGDGIFANIGLPINNALALRIKPLENLTVIGAYSLAVDTEATSYGDNSHYGALGAAYQTDRLWAGFTYEIVTPGKNAGNRKDDQVLKAAASYDFGPVRFFAAYSHTNDHEWYGERMDSDSYRIGATAPLSDGLLRASLQYFDGGDTTVDGEIFTLKRFVAALGYTYNLSTRTMLWTTYSYSFGRDSLDKDTQSDKAMASDEDRSRANRQLLSLGMTHFF